MTNGLRSSVGVAATPFTKGPYAWDQQLTWNVTQTAADLSQGGNASDELRGVVINATLTETSGTGIAGLRVYATTAGSSGAWANGIYGEVKEGSTQNVTGYLSGGEFQTTKSGDFAAYWGVLTLNAADSRTGAGTANAYIWCRQYGSATGAATALFWFYDQSVVAGSSGHGTTLLESAADTTATHYIPIKYGSGGTKLYLMATTTAPS
jgi:hypothetical protein